MIKTAKTKTSELQYGSDNIVRVRILEGIELEISDVKEILNTCNGLTQGKNHSVLLDGRGQVSATKEAREFGASQKITKNRIAEAILVDSLASKLMANVYVQFNKPKIPTKIFTDEDEALSWLRSFDVDGVYLGITG